MVSRKRLALILAIEVAKIAVLWGSFYYYAYYGGWGEDFGPKSSREIVIQSYNATRDGSGFNLSLIICNSGEGQVTIGKISMEEHRELPNGTYIPPHNWITIGEYNDLEINPGETKTINIYLSEGNISKTGTNSQIKVETIDGIFIQTGIDLLRET